MKEMSLTSLRIRRAMSIETGISSSISIALRWNRYTGRYSSLNAWCSSDSEADAKNAFKFIRKSQCTQTNGTGCSDMDRNVNIHGDHQFVEGNKKWQKVAFHFKN